jgi:4-hydroxymandelate oxidase
MPTTRREVLLSTGALAGTSLLTGREALSQQSDPLEEEVAAALNVWDFKKIAQQRLSQASWDFITGAAGDEITMRWNREAYDRIRLEPNVLVDVSGVDTRTRLFGQEIPFPILVSPSGGHSRSHPDGELATARGAGQAQAIMAVSTLSSKPIEELAQVATQSLWFQLYMIRDRGLTREIVERAEAAGCKAICITVDTPVTGARNREQRAGRRRRQGSGAPRALPPHLTGYKRPESVEGPIFSSTLDPTITWKEINWVRSFARVPVLIKGVLNPADAQRAVQEGISGIIVSNHGGRNLDTVPATIDALPRIADQVAGRFPILIDSGIRRGTDILKAVALGANAVMIGRPTLYGLASAGPEGVSRVIEILRRELEMAMALTGRTTLSQIDRSVLWQG